MLAGTLTQNDMQVVRMWIGGSDFRDLDQLHPLPSGTHLHPCYVPLRYLFFDEAKI